MCSGSSPFSSAATANSPREPGPAPAARRLQTSGSPAKAPSGRPPVLDQPSQTLDRLAGGAGHRLTRHRPALAAATLPRLLDPALASVTRRPPTCQHRGRHARQNDGHGESPVGSAAHPRHTSPITIRRAHISRSTRTPPTSGRSRSPPRGRSCSFPKLAACTIATSAKPRSPASSVGLWPRTG